MYGNIGFTRQDKTPAYWEKDFRLRPTAKKMIQDIKAEREQLFRALEASSDDMSDEDYDIAQRELSAALDTLIEREDTIRRNNPA